MKKITSNEYHVLRGRYALAIEADPVDVAALRFIEEQTTEARDRLVALRDQRAASILAPDPNVRRTPEERDHSDHAQDDVQVLERGLWGQGYWDSALEEFADSVGLSVLDRLIADCREVIEREEQRPTMTWPAKFCYVGKPGAAILNGNVVRVGEVVELTEGQAEAWADRFVPAEQPVETSASS